MHVLGLAGSALAVSRATRDLTIHNLSMTCPPGLHDRPPCLILGEQISFWCKYINLAVFLRQRTWIVKTVHALSELLSVLLLLKWSEWEKSVCLWKVWLVTGGHSSDPQGTVDKQEWTVEKDFCLVGGEGMGGNWSHVKARIFFYKPK